MISARSLVLRIDLGGTLLSVLLCDLLHLVALGIHMQSKIKPAQHCLKGFRLAVEMSLFHTF